MANNGVFLPRSIQFKSEIKNWRKEYSGLKNNLVKIYDSSNDKGDKRFQLLNEFEAGKLQYLEVKIHNIDTGQKFYRKVRDVTKSKINNRKTLYIITWGAGYGS